MKWDATEIKDKIISIRTKISVAKEEDLLGLVIELENLENMLGFIEGKGDCRHQSLVTEKENLEKEKFLHESLGDYTINLNILNNSRSLPYYLFAKSRISEIETLKLVKEFCQNFPFDFKTVFEDICKESHLNLSNKKHPQNFLGITHHFPSFDTSYINAYFNGRISCASTIIHELAHAYQHKGANYSQAQKMVRSALTESFPRFSEFVFLDFLKTTKYDKTALNSRRGFLENLDIILEYSASAFGDVISNNHPERKSLNIASSYLSNLLAYYFLHQYRLKDYSSIEEFNKVFKNGQEYAFFESLKPSTIVDSVRDEFKNIYATRA